jgi:hypothetical protein
VTITYRIDSYRQNHLLLDAMENKDLILTQDVLCYSESRFKKVFLAMDKHQRGGEKHPKWLDLCLVQELVSLGYIEDLGHIPDFKSAIHSYPYW